MQWPLALLNSVLSRKRQAEAFAWHSFFRIHGPFEVEAVAFASCETLAHIDMMENCDVYLYGPPTDALPEVDALVLDILERFGVDRNNATCFVHETPCVYLASWKRPRRMPAFGFRGVPIGRGEVQVLEDAPVFPLCAHSFLIQDVARQRQRQMRFRTFGIAFGAANYSGERRTLEYLTDGVPTLERSHAVGGGDGAGCAHGHVSRRARLASLGFWVGSPVPVPNFVSEVQGSRFRAI